MNYSTLIYIEYFENRCVLDATVNKADVGQNYEMAMVAQS